MIKTNLIKSRENANKLEFKIVPQEEEEQFQTTLASIGNHISKSKHPLLYNIFFNINSNYFKFIQK